MDIVSPRRGAVAGMTKRCKDGVPRARRTGGVSMMRFGERRRVATAVVAAAAALLLPAAAAAQDAGPVTAGVTFFTGPNRSEEHTSELQSLMRNSYAVFCLKKKQN